MTFKAKLSKQGNSYCIYVPKSVRTNLSTDEEYEWEVRTSLEEEVRTQEVGVLDTETQTMTSQGKLTFNVKKGIYERK